MANKKTKEINIEIPGEVNFQSIDKRAVRVTLSGNNVIGPRRFEIDRSLFPADYEDSKYKVSGSFKMDIIVKEK